MTFAARLDACVDASGSLLCCGLDPDGFASAAQAEHRCLEIVDETIEHVCAFKPNLAFFEQLGSAGYAILERLRTRIPGDRILILDAKRGDTGNTAEAYARALFDVLGADCVTVNPLMGSDSVLPFLQRRDRGALLVARSSNPGAADLLDQHLASGEQMSARIVELGLGWDPGGAVGFVVGATRPDAVAEIRRAAPDAPLLLPGVGAQGGALEESISAGLDARGRGAIISVSRGIASAPEGAARAAAGFRERIEEIRAAVALR
ncbi:MAG TPA: orotidine-5'-phosphate decarboxylase [Candidatus Saccharimonadales bacterium]|nr:orotidine-5'-phosphate decarboxylase [Candidatus Saccharimonadales bacterium]